MVALAGLAELLGAEPVTRSLQVLGDPLFALERQARRVGRYEDSVFLRTRAGRYRVTPKLIPVVETMQTQVSRSR